MLRSRTRRWLFLPSSPLYLCGVGVDRGRGVSWAEDRAEQARAPTDVFP
jgi:hypothetical protein